MSLYYYPCPNCGKKVGSSDRFCRYCGEALFRDLESTGAAGYQCPYCSAEVTYAATSCPNCDEQLWVPDTVRRKAMLGSGSIEEALLWYLEEHGYRVKLSDAADALRITTTEVDRILRALQEKGIIRTRGTQSQ